MGIERNLNEQQIEEIIPHREPIRLINEIIEVEFGERAVSILADLTKPEYDWLKLDFGDGKFIPHTILLEALAQTGAVAVLRLPQNKGKIAMLTGVEEMGFYRTIKPEDQVRLEIEILRLRSNAGKGRGRALLDNQIAVEGIISFAIVDKPSEFP